MKPITILMAIALLTPALCSPTMAYFKKKSLLVEKKDRPVNDKRLNPKIRPINKRDKLLNKRDKHLNPPPWGHCRAKCHPALKNT